MLNQWIAERLVRCGCLFISMNKTNVTIVRAWVHLIVNSSSAMPVRVRGQTQTETPFLAAKKQFYRKVTLLVCKQVNTLNYILNVVFVNLISDRNEGRWREETLWLMSCYWDPYITSRCIVILHLMYLALLHLLELFRSYISSISFATYFDFACSPPKRRIMRLYCWPKNINFVR